jgi:polysaccharide export outer membrane protein
VDLQRFLQGADSGSLPPLLPGDLVYVPGASGFGGQAVAGAGSNVAYVFGQVARPGAYPVTGGADLVEVLALAGGATPIANLKRVQVVARDGGVVVAEVDVEAYLASGATAGFPVRAGDTINVPTQQVGVLNKAWGIAGQALSLSRDVLNAVLIIDYFN